MDAQLIEQLDRRRYRNLLWIAIGFSILYGALIITNISPGSAIRTISALVCIPGGAIFITALFRNMAIQREMKRRPELTEALNNELIVLYKYKSLKRGFLAAIASAGVLYITARWVPTFTIETVCLTIIYTGCLTVMISQLVYLKK